MVVKQDPTNPASLTDLQSWFSIPRMQTFGTGAEAVDLYLWDAQMSKAILEDIQHFEVLLRNWFDSILAPHYGSYWFDSEVHPSALSFSNKDKVAVHRARSRAGGSEVPPGKIIAELSFDFWWYLLGNRHATTVHNKIAGHFNYQHGVAEFKTRVETIYRLRNRCAHHEPVVKPDLNQESAAIEKFLAHLTEAASWISPKAGQWISDNSRIMDLYRERPQASIPPNGLAT